VSVGEDEVAAKLAAQAKKKAANDNVKTAKGEPEKAEPAEADLAAVAETVTAP